MAKDLLYKPSLGYEKNYYTEGEIYNQDQEQQIVTNQIDKTPSQIKLDNIIEVNDKVKDKISILPDDLLNIFLPPYITVNDIINSLKDEVEKLPVVTPEKIVVDEDTIISDDDDSNDHNSNDDSYSSDPFGPPIEIVTIELPEEISKADKQQIQYISDLEDIIYDYLNRYDDVLNKYTQAILTYHSYSNNKSLKMITTVDLVNSNLSHVSDFITKSSISLKRRMSLYRKLYTIDKSIYHFRAVKVANEQVKRYKSNTGLKNTNALTKISNGILKESELVAEKKYEENFYSLYKYLNSSVILLNECTNIMANQKSALILLNNEERGN